MEKRAVLQLSTDDLRLIAERFLEKIDPVDYGLDKHYINDLRDALLDMVNGLEQTGEFELEVSNEPRSKPKSKRERDDPDPKSNPDAEPGTDNPPIKDEAPESKDDSEAEEDSPPDKSGPRPAK